MSFKCDMCSTAQSSGVKPYTNIIKREKTYQTYNCSCGSQVNKFEYDSYGVKVCPVCGSRIVSNKIKTTQGTEIEREEKVCPECAHKLGIINDEEWEETERRFKVSEKSRKKTMWNILREKIRGS